VHISVVEDTYPPAVAAADGQHNIIVRFISIVKICQYISRPI